MPGIAGCLRLAGDRSLPPDFADALLAPLGREPDYAAQPIVADAAAHAVVLAPQLSFAVAGAATDDASGISAGYYGEFFGPDFPPGDAAAIALKLIELYLGQGADFAASLDGTFVVFIHDPRRGEDILANDHYASRPVCYAQQNGLLYFSPEPKGIAQLPGFEAHTDEAALLMVLTHGHLLGSATYYREVQYLPPGSILRVSGGRVELRRYFEYLVNEKMGGADAPELAEELAAVMRGAIRKRRHHLPHLVIPISGGYDSRGILAMVREMTGARLTTVSWGTDEQTADADAAIGRRVAEFYGTHHHFLPRRFTDSITAIEETVARVDGGSVDAVMHPNELQLMRTIRREWGTDYLFRGDEIFGFKGEACTRTEALARVGLQELGNYPALVDLLHPGRRAEFLKLSSEAVERAQAECPLALPSARKDYLHYNHKIRNFANRSNYYKLGILEAANPWLDKDVVEFLRRVPAPCRIDKVLYRRTLAAAFPTLMQLPIARRNSLEDFARLTREDAAWQKFIRFHLLERHNRFHEMIAREPLARLLDAAFAGRAAGPARVRLYAAAKQTLRRAAPKLFQAVRARAHQGNMVVSTISPDLLILRLLLMKVWCDRLP